MSRRRRLRSDRASFSGCQQEIGHNQSAFKSPYRLFFPPSETSVAASSVRRRRKTNEIKPGREREKRDHFPSLPDKSRVDRPPSLPLCVCSVLLSPV